MKKLLIVVGIVFLLLILVVVAVPIFFKDDIQRALDKTMDESLNAHVYYDIDNFSLSLIKNFPDLTVSMSDFGVVGIGLFEEDTLTSVQNFQVTVDIMSVISGDQIIVEEIRLDEPKIMVMVLPDGTANYDIMKETPETTEPEEGNEEQSAGNVSVSINEWSINNADLIYLDQSLNFYTTLIGLNHQGSGDFTLDVFDLVTNTTVDEASLGFEGTEYVSDKRLALDVILNMDLGNMTFTFKENRIAVNDFAMIADGYLSMPGEDINMDVTFGGQDINLKSILSLIPGVYQSYLDGVEAAGNVSFDGFVKGTFNETTMPQVAANLSVSDGSVRYSEFDIPIEAINIQTGFNYPSADLSQTTFNVDKFSMLVDGESVEAYLKVKNLDNYHWDFGFDGNADLEKITKIVPLEGMTLAGRINTKLKTAGKMSDLKAERYDLLPTSGSMTVDNFIFRSEEYLPQGFAIAEANLLFDPSAITLQTFSASSGNSDFNMVGNISNYLGFALADEMLTGRLDFTSSLIDLNEWMSEEENEEEVEEETGEPLEVIKIPENIDFTLASAINKIAYSNMPITNFKGNVIVRDGAVLLDKNSFNLLGGAFGITGSYVTKDLEKPKYSLAFDVKNLSISRAFETFETVQSYVPIAKQVSGDFSTELNVSGLLGSDMMPLLDKIDLKGLVSIAEATLDKGDFLQKLSAVAALKGAGSQPKQKISLKDVLVSAQIKDGRMFVEPFELEVNNQRAVLGGSNGLDGSLDYSMLLKDVPTGQIGKALNNALSSFTGGKQLVADKINLNLGIGGTYDNPSVKLLGTGNAGTSGGGAAENLKADLKNKFDDQKARAKAKLEEQKALAEAKAEAALDSAKTALTSRKKAAEDSLKAVIDAKKKAAEKAAKDKVKDLFKRKGGGE